jgi:hypothetical protein
LIRRDLDPETTLAAVDVSWTIMPPAARSRSAIRTTVKNSHRLSFRLRTAISNEHTVEQLKDMLGDDAYGTAYAEGQALRLEQSLDLALAASASDPS